jgi:hypothetical protein
MTVPLKIFKNSVPTAQKLCSVFLANGKSVTLFSEIIVVYSENYTRRINIGKVQRVLRLKEVVNTATILL